MEPLEKFNPPMFNMYDGKSNTRSYISHFKQMMALCYHIDALICKVFSSILGDLRLKWFEKLLPESIGSFLQLFKSFVAWFVINTKAPKCVSSLLSLHKGKNETLYNNNKKY